MALDAGVVGVHVVEPRRVDDGLPRPLFHVLAAWAVTLFAADIPFARLLGVDVVVHRMAAIAKRARGALKIIPRIERRPPILIGFDDVLPPNLVHDVPLGGFYVIVIPDLLEVSLFP